MIDQIREYLFQLQDRKYREFQCKLIPNVDPETVIGIRTPVLRSYAGILAKEPEITSFLRDLPHRYFDENQLHAFLISENKDYPRCVDEVERFLPYVDNWATCDQMTPAVFRKHRDDLIKAVRRWLNSEHPYTVRFGIRMLMDHYLEEDFDPEYPSLVAGIRSDEYYVKMMVAWYFATALAKRYEDVLPYLKDGRLDAWTQNMTVRKATESYRITAEQKAYLKTLKRIQN